MSNQPPSLASEQEGRKNSEEVDYSGRLNGQERIVVPSGGQQQNDGEDGDERIRQIKEKNGVDGRKEEQKDNNSSTVVRRVRQPLRLKFKAIIINKVIGQIYRIDHNNLTRAAFILMKQHMYQKRIQSRLTLAEIESRTQKVLFSSLEYLLQAQQHKLLQTGLRALLTE